MPQKRISKTKIKRLIVLYSVTNLNKSELCDIVKISKSTANKYLNQYKKSDLSYPDIKKLTGQNLINALGFKKPYYSKRYELLEKLLPAFHEQCGKSDLKTIWKEYKYYQPSGYGYSQFVLHYNKWRNENNTPKVIHNKCNLPSLNKKDRKALSKWRSSSYKRRWERAVALLDLNNGIPITKISKKIEKSPRTIKKWVRHYENNGLIGLDLHRKRKVDKKITDKIKQKKKRLIKLLHQTPQISDINRTS
jgi:transposase